MLRCCAIGGKSALFGQHHIGQVFNAAWGQANWNGHGAGARYIGETRAAHYLTAHLDQLLKVKQLTDAGISLERIAEIQNGEELQIPAKPRKPGDIQVKSHIHVAPGIELQISPEEADMSPEQIRALVKAVMKTIQEIKA